MLVFHAPWCRACRAFGHKLRHVAEKRPRLLFINIDVSQLESVVEALGVQALPYVQFYDAPTGQVFGGTTGSVRPERMNELASAIAHFDVPRCDLTLPRIPQPLASLMMLRHRDAYNDADAGDAFEREQQHDDKEEKDEELFPFMNIPAISGATRCR